MRRGELTLDLSVVLDAVRHGGSPVALAVPSTGRQASRYRRRGTGRQPDTARLRVVVVALAVQG